MGQHKTNPTALKAKNGEIPPKKKTLSKRESERLAMAVIRGVTGADAVWNALNHNRQ